MGNTVRVYCTREEVARWDWEIHPGSPSESPLKKIRNPLQGTLRPLPKTLIILRERFPNRRMMRHSGHTPINYPLPGGFLPSHAASRISTSMPKHLQDRYPAPTRTKPLPANFPNLAFEREGPCGSADYKGVIFRSSEGAS